MRKTKALVSCAVTSQLISAFVFASAKIQFSHDEAQKCIIFILNIHCIVIGARKDFSTDGSSAFSTGLQLNCFIGCFIISSVMLFLH